MLAGRSSTVHGYSASHVERESASSLSGYAMRNDCRDEKQRAGLGLLRALGSKAQVALAFVVFAATVTEGEH